MLLFKLLGFWQLWMNLKKIPNAAEKWRKTSDKFSPGLELYISNKNTSKRIKRTRWPPGTLHIQNIKKRLEIYLKFKYNIFFWLWLNIYMHTFEDNGPKPAMNSKNWPLYSKIQKCPSRIYLALNFYLWAWITIQINLKPSKNKFQRGWR